MVALLHIWSFKERVKINRNFFCCVGEGRHKAARHHCVCSFFLMSRVETGSRVITDPTAVKTQSFSPHKFFVWLLTSAGSFWLCEFKEDGSIFIGFHSLSLKKKKEREDYKDSQQVFSEVRLYNSYISFPVMKWCFWKYSCPLNHELRFKRILTSVFF